MATLDTRPEVVDIAHYAGDTLTIRVDVPDGLVAGRTWSAQVRGNRTDVEADADFTISEDATGAWLTLSAADARRLAELAGVTVRPSLVRYTGSWDVQLAPADGGDPTTTLAHGTLTIEQDVTQ